jgi:hypothetical protein
MNFTSYVELVLQGRFKRPTRGLENYLFRYMLDLLFSVNIVNHI